MNNHTHIFTNMALGFLLGFTVSGIIIAEANGGKVYQDTVNEYVVLNASTDGEKHTCGYITEEGVTENLDAYAERCPDDVTAAAEKPEPVPAPAPAPEVVTPPTTIAPPPPVVSTIGGAAVPYGLDCEEDEVIALLPSPYEPGIDYDEVGCVHIDTFSGG
jgi:hypothetical protein